MATIENGEEPIKLEEQKPEKWKINKYTKDVNFVARKLCEVSPVLRRCTGL